uniref:PDIL2-1 n=1 Tax=Arundo donax TaxID=35708 RepID=A0A0A9FP51_ARUDO
MVWPLQEACP